MEKILKPAKKYYSLLEVVNKWNKYFDDELMIYDLADYAVEGELVLSIVVPDSVFVAVDHAGKNRGEVYVKGPVRINGKRLLKHNDGDGYYCVNDCFVVDGLTKTKPRFENAKYYHLLFLANNIATFGNSIKTKLDNLVVLNEDIERFEKKHGILSIVDEAMSGDIKNKRVTDINRWLWKTWTTEGEPGGADFFRILGEKYYGVEGSPVLEFLTGSENKFRWRTEASTGCWSKKTIANKVCDFKNGKLY